MTDPRNPLITGVTNDASYRGTDNLPTSYAVNQLFAGQELTSNDGTGNNVNNVIKCGTYRFNSSTINLPSHLLGTSGLLTVLHERPSVPSADHFENDPASTNYTPNVVRQIVWPDGPSDVTPYTRTKQGGIWGEWQTMGGNLRRVALTQNTNALTNVMYYSFGNYTLTLPNPNEYPLATRIGLEQWSGNGSVVASYNNDTFTQTTSPAYEADESGAPTSTNLGPQIYTFEICDNGQGGHVWIMDIDNNISNTITGIRKSISDESLTRFDALKELDALIGSGFSAPYIAWKNGSNIVYTKKDSPKGGDTYYTGTESNMTTGGSITDIVRDSSTKLVTHIKIGSTSYQRYPDGNIDKTSIAAIVFGNNASESSDIEDLGDRLGSGVNTNVTTTVGSSGTATRQFTELKDLIGLYATNNGNRIITSTTSNSNIGVTGTIASQLVSGKTKIDDINSRIGNGFDSNNTITSKVTELVNKIGSANIEGEGSPISGLTGKSISEIISNKDPRTAVYDFSDIDNKPNGNIVETSTLKDSNNITYQFKDILHRIHPIIVVSETGKSITLPGATSYSSGTKCTLELPPGKTITVLTSGSISESFTNQAGSGYTTVLPFEVTYDASKTLVWSLITTTVTQ